MFGRQQHNRLDYEILYHGAFPIIRARLRAGESIKAESDAMISMSTTVELEGRLEGGILGGLGRFMAGERIFFQTIVARHGAGEVLLAHAYPGDILALELDGRPYILQKDGYLASEDTIEISAHVQNLAQGFLSGEGFFVMKVRGYGTLFISSYGAIHPIDIPPGEEVIIDNYHLVAWPDGMDYKIEKASSGWLSSFTSGEKLVCRFRGPGRVLIQTRNASGFGAWLKQFVPG